MDKKIPTIKHEFALYLEHLSSAVTSLQKDSTFVIDDLELVHRITHVLRLAPEDIVVLFDRTGHITIRLQEITKKKVIGTLLSIESNKSLRPSITFFLPLLKKHDLETALYSLTEIGVQEIALVSTQKTQKGLAGSEKEFERLQRIIIAAAEQSKNFCLPTLRPPVPLNQALEAFNLYDVCIHFDPEGESLLRVANKLASQKLSNIALMVGPEGDLTPPERHALQEHGVLLCSLTPTVLRSVQAIAIGSGFIRSIL